MSDGAVRKLTSIVSIDVAGYSRRTEADEAAAVQAVASLRRLIFERAAAHGGRVFNTAGDGFMLDFPTVSGAIEAAGEIAAAADPPVRAGIHLGEVYGTEGGDLLGHGVNVAARVQQQAAPGAVLVSGDVQRTIRGPLAERLKRQGSVRLDKMSAVMPLYALAPAEPGGRVHGRKRGPAPILAAAVAALLIVAIGVALALRTSWFAPQPDRISVAPFQAIGDGADLRDFAASLSDSLQSTLNTSNMQTVSSTDAAGLSGKDRDQLIRQLRIRLLLDGTVSRDGAALTVRMRLDDPVQHANLWTIEVSGPASQPGPLQAQAGARAITVLNCSAQALKPIGGLRDASILTSFLKACDAFETGDQTSINTAYKLFDALRQVTSRAPEFAYGHAMLAKFLAWFTPVFPPDQQAALRQEAQEEVHKALAIDPRQPDAYVGLFLLEPVSHYLRREQLLRQGLATDPDWQHTNGFLGEVLMQVGRPSDATPFLLRAASRNPQSLDWADAAALNLAWVGQAEQADAAYTHLREVWPQSDFVWADHLFSLDWAGRRAKVEEILKSAQDRPASIPPPVVAFLTEFYDTAAAHDPARIARMRAEILSTATTPTGVSQAIPLLSQLGLVDDAFHLADRLQPAQFNNMNDNGEFLFQPPTTAMRRDPRFIGLANRLGLLAYWRSTGKWPEFCRDPALPYDCKAEAAKLAGR